MVLKEFEKGVERRKKECWKGFKLFLKAFRQKNIRDFRDFESLFFGFNLTVFRLLARRWFFGKWLN